MKGTDYASRESVRLNLIVDFPQRFDAPLDFQAQVFWFNCAPMNAFIKHGRNDIVMNLGMCMYNNNIANNIDPKIKSIRVNEDEIIAQLLDGRIISVPLAWSWRLSEATEEQRKNYEFIGDGIGVHWPDIDEDLSAQGMLTGIPARPLKQKV